jgi:peptide chain release factor 1
MTDWVPIFEDIRRRYDALVEALGAEDILLQDRVDKNRSLAKLTPLMDHVERYGRVEEELRLLEDMGDDEGEEMERLMGEEREVLKADLLSLEEEMKWLLLPHDDADDGGGMLEIRAGTGGDEAGLFVMDLLRMYMRYAERLGWKTEMVSCDENALGGSSQVVMWVKGEGVYGRLRREGGVHRVQRVPVTESGGRIHTSTVTVAILPQAEDVDVEIDSGDLRIDTYRAQGAGGQHVNKTDSAVRITHIPSGLVSQCQDHKSQHRNRLQAMEVLRSRLYDRERQEKDALRANDRRGQIGSGDRSERIRTYNFPQGRVTDHRLPLTLYKLESVLAGETLDELIEPLLLKERQEMLKNWGMGEGGGGL